MKTYVIAGDYKQFLYYYPQPDKDIIYVHSERQLRGAHGGKVVRVGTWYERDDIDKLEKEVANIALTPRAVRRI